MTAPIPQPGDDHVFEDVPEAVDSADSAGPIDAVDQRMADVLRGSSSGADLRRELEGDRTEAASDLLSRLNALDFVQQVVGTTSDVPERIGSYSVKGVLGRGGMGTVYLGWQEELEREVALKVLSPNYSSDPTMRKRFRAEARATAALHHRHIVPIYDYGEAHGVLFFAMERVHGMSLDKHIAAARRVGKLPLDPLEAARRFAGVADALGLAHRRRLLHRDVKPGNIMVAQDGTLALTDFGLAKALDHASMHLTSKGGGFLGTLHYSSPEQALGADTTPASDLYSLGVTIFEAVTGELPRAGKNTEALLQSILHGTPRRLRDCLPKPPRDLEAVVDKLLSREAADRYQDGEGLARDLQRIADGEPVHIRRLPLHVRAWRRMRKNPVLSGAIAAAAVLLLLTLFLLTVWRREHGQGLLLRHQGALVTIAKDISIERGDTCGPAAMLLALTGIDTAPEPPNDAILRALQRADREQPGDEQVALMRTAYEDDPAASATAFLREGRGFEALRELDPAIGAAVARRTSGDLVSELQLYRLVLARAVANLTAAVARPTDARSDLALASYLRPGAVFPAVLTDVLNVLQSRDIVASTSRLENDLRAAAAERRRATALLLWSAAALQPHKQANLMDFALRFPARRALHELAARWLGEKPADCRRAGEPTGLSAELADSCRIALDRLGDPEYVRTLEAATKAVFEKSVHPDSPLQGWRIVLQMLLQAPQRGSVVDRERRQLSPLLQLEAWDDLLQLSPPRSMVRLWLERFEDLRAEHPNLPGVVRVAAQMHVLAGSTKAPAMVQQWIEEADGDPEALLCRMRASLRAVASGDPNGSIAEASDDAIAAIQGAVDPLEMLGVVVRVCNEALPELPAGHNAALQLIVQQLQALQSEGFAPAWRRR